MNVYSLLSANQNTAIGTLPWGKLVLDTVNLQLPPDRQVDPSITGRALSELIFTLENRQRAGIFSLDVPLDDDDPQNNTPAAGGRMRKYALIFAASLMILMIVIVAGYIAITAINGQTPDQSTLETLFKFIGTLLQAIMGGTVPEG